MVKRHFVIFVEFEDVRGNLLQVSKTLIISYEPIRAVMRIHLCYRRGRFRCFSHILMIMKTIARLRTVGLNYNAHDSFCHRRT